MRIVDLLRETWSALTANKGRSLLTVLGIVIGIAAVIAMTSLIGGVKQSLIDELGLGQSRVLYIYAYVDQGVTFDDLDKIAERTGDYEFITGVQDSYGKASTPTKQVDASIIGMWKNSFTALGAKLDEGRLLTESELSGAPFTAVIDTTMSRKLFGEESAVGQTLRLGEDEYTIVGTVEAANMISQGGTVYIPYQTCAQRVSGFEEISTILGYAREGADIEALSMRTKEVIYDYFSIPRGDDEEGGFVSVESMKSIQDSLDATMMSFQVLMTAVASISLIVGGIGIMNMMLTNVTERIREIGLRKALGARRRDITLQFLMESVALCIAGGIIGIIIGYIGAFALSGAASSLAEGMPVVPYFSITTILVVVAICVGIGIVFGYWPAHRAARLDPVESLHYQ